MTQAPHTVEPHIAVRVNDYYYRLFRIVIIIQQSAKTAKLLAHFGERSIITKMPNGYGIWRLDTILKRQESSSTSNSE